MKRRLSLTTTRHRQVRRLPPRSHRSRLTVLGVCVCIVAAASSLARWPAPRRDGAAQPPDGQQAHAYGEKAQDDVVHLCGSHSVVGGAPDSPGPRVLAPTLKGLGAATELCGGGSLSPYWTLVLRCPPPQWGSPCQAQALPGQSEMPIGACASRARGGPGRRIRLRATQPQRRPILREKRPMPDQRQPEVARSAPAASSENRPPRPSSP